MNRRSAIKFGAIALILAGLLWFFKAAFILLTGNQPPLALELGQILFPIGLIGLYFTVERPGLLAKPGLISAILGIAGASLGLLYSLLPGARISTGDTFVWPYSLFVLLGSAGGFVGLALLGAAIARSETQWGRWRRVPLIVALLPLPALLTGLIHIEIPVLIIGMSWAFLGYCLWRVEDGKIS